MKRFIRGAIANYKVVAFAWAVLFVLSCSERVFAAQRSLDSVVSAWLKELRQAGASVSVDGMDAEQPDASAQLRGVTVSVPGVDAFSLKIGRLVLSGPAETDARYEASEATAYDVIFAYGDVVATLHSATFRAVAVPKFVSKPSDAQHRLRALLASIKSLLGSSWDTVSLDGLEVGYRTAASTKTSVAKIEAGKLRAGALAAVNFADFKVDALSAGNRIVFSHAEAANLRFAALIEALAGEGPVGGKRGWIDLVDAVKLSAAEWRGPKQRFEVSQATFAGIRTQSFPFDVGEFFDRATSDPQYLAQNPNRQRQFIEALLQAVKVAHISFNGLELDDGATPPLRRLRFQTMEVENIDPLNAELVSVNGVDGASGEIGLKIDRAGASTLHLQETNAPKGEDIAPPRVLIFSGGFIEKAQLGKSGIPIKLESLRFQSPEHLGVVPTMIDATLSGLHLPVEVIADPNLRSLITALELKSMDVDAKLHAKWEETAESISLSGADLYIHGIGSLHVDGSVSGVRKAVLERSDNLMSGLAAAGIERIRLRFKDESFVTRLLNAYATANKSTPDQIRMALSANMPVILGAIPQPSIRNELIFSLVGFLNETGMLEIKSTMLRPVPIAELFADFAKGPSAIPGLLQLTSKVVRDDKKP